MSDSGVRTATEAETNVAVGVTVTAQVSERRSIVIQTALARDAPVAEYHALLDKAEKAISRQEAKANLEGMKASLATHEKQLRNLTEDFQRVEANAQVGWEGKGKRGPVQLSPADKAHKLNIGVNVKRYQEEIARLNADIVKTEAIIAQDT